MGSPTGKQAATYTTSCRGRGGDHRVRSSLGKIIEGRPGSGNGKKDPGENMGSWWNEGKGQADAYCNQNAQPFMTMAGRQATMITWTGEHGRKKKPEDVLKEIVYLFKQD